MKEIKKNKIKSNNSDGFLASKRSQSDCVHIHFGSCTKQVFLWHLRHDSGFMWVQHTYVSSIDSPIQSSYEKHKSTFFSFASMHNKARPFGGFFVVDTEHTHTRTHARFCVQHLIYKLEMLMWDTPLVFKTLCVWKEGCFFLAMKENLHKTSLKWFVALSKKNAAQNGVTKRTETAVANGRVGDIKTSMFNDKVLSSVIIMMIIIIFFLPHVGLCNYLGTTGNIPASLQAMTCKIWIEISKKKEATFTGNRVMQCLIDHVVEFN